MATVSELLLHFEEFWPKNQAEDWDRVGLVVGSADDHVRQILVSVDLTDAVIDEAIKCGASLILTHHPLLLRAVHSVSESETKGYLIAKLIRNNIACFSAHTNADVQNDGASALMAKKFGLINLDILVPVTPEYGHGIIGDLNDPVTLGEFAKVVAAALPAVARKVVFSGREDLIVNRVAICSGSGDGFIGNAIESDADVYVTSDLRHHPAQEAISTPRAGDPLALIDVSHWAAESLWVTGAVKHLNAITGITAIASQINTDPWTQEVN